MKREKSEGNEEERRGMGVLEFFGLVFDGFKHAAWWLFVMFLVVFLFGFVAGWVLNALW